MRNRVGPPVSGRDFYPRPQLMARLCRRLASGDNIYLLAPRRSGKTSVMFELTEQPCEGHTFVYVNTEPVSDQEQFFSKVLFEVLQSEVVENLPGRLEKVKSFLGDLLNRVKKIGPLELNQKLEEKPSDIFSELITKIDATKLKLVIMVDEFPSTVANILKKSGPEAAVSFLQLNRNLRQHPNCRVQMIYTGSIGLPALVSKLVTSSSVNDLSNFEIPPFTRDEATGMCLKIFETEKVPVEEGVIEALLDEVGWLMPFFVQLVIGQAIELYDAAGNSGPITVEMVKTAVENSTSLRSNNHFESYYQRINTSFSEEDAAYAHELLRKIAHEGSVKADSALHVNPERRRFMLNSLELDGYITNINRILRFHSPILKKWWQRFAY